MPREGMGKCVACGHRASSRCPSCGQPICSEHLLASHWDLVESAGARAELLLGRVGGDEACTACFEEQLARQKPPYAVIHRDTDPKRVRELMAALERDGFDPRGVGLESAALLGEGQQSFAAWIEVPVAQRDAARMLVQQLAEQPTSLELTAEPPDA